MRRAGSRWVALVLVAPLAACAPGPLELPTGAGAPFPDSRAAFEEATRSCRDVRTWTAEVALAGRAGGTKIRGRLFAGLARPRALRIEGLAPFGQPVFILVARAGEATLLLPRDRRVLRQGSAATIVEALAGVALGPDELLHIVTGCLADGEPTDGRTYARGWHAVDLADSTTAFVRQTGGRWRIEAGTLPGLTVEYRDFAGARPRRVRLRAQPSGDSAGADLTLTISQVETNVTLPDNVFTLDVPADAVPLTLDELRDAGPLGVKR